MADDISGKGDPVRTLALLWGFCEPQKRGPKPKLALADIVSTAVRIADAEGLGAVSTRRVAEEVGISPMSFYTYVPGKAELLDLMLDSVVGEDMAPPRPVFDPARWRDNLTVIARGLRGYYMKHAWVLDLATHRPVLGPNTINAYEVALSAIDGLGLSEIDMDMTITLIANYVHGAVRDAARERMVKETTGMTDEQWWRRVEPFLADIDWSPYPVAARIGPVVGAAYGAHDPERAFTFGLERVLDGLAVFLDAKASVPRVRTKRPKRAKTRAARPA